MVETKIIDGKQIAKELREKLALQVQQMKTTPKLAVILIGDHPASLLYVKNKQKYAKEVGIDVDVYHLPYTEKQENVFKLIEELNASSSVNGILLQLPVPEHLEADKLISAIDYRKDVDGLNPINVGKMVSQLPAMIPCTPLGCLYLIKQVMPDLKGKRAVVVGRSALVGRPLAHLLLQEDCTTTIAHSKTKDLSAVCQEADILVSAVGKVGLIKGQMIKEGAVVIDVGINRLSDGKLTGDVLFLDMMGKASFVTPVPGGVGPMTIAMLLWNVIQSAKGHFSECKTLVVKK